MITTRIYENSGGDLEAVVLEDGAYSNYVVTPELTTLDSESFISDAKLGFPEAAPYEFDLMIGLSMEQAAEKIEKEGTLIAETGERVIMYPKRMGEYARDFFAGELGEAIWQKALELDAGAGVRLNI